jgi:hypothetical protein
VSPAPGTALAIGDEIETPDGGTVSLTYVGDTIRVRVEKETSVRLLEQRNGRALRLDRGGIAAAVGPRREGRHFAVVTPHAGLTVLGTEFSVSASEKATGLQVSEGTVRMSLREGDHYRDVGEGSVAFAKAGLDRVVVPGKLVRTIEIAGLPAGARVTGIAVAREAVWIHADRGEGLSPVLARLDPATGKITDTMERVERGFKSGSCISWKEGLLWGFSPDGTGLQGIDVESGTVSRALPLPAEAVWSPRTFDLHAGIGWLRGRTRYELLKVDLKEGAVIARITCPFAIDRIAASGSAVYVGERGWNACRIDPNDGGVIYRFLCEAKSSTGDMAIGEGGRLWTIQGAEPRVHVVEIQ